MYQKKIGIDTANISREDVLRFVHAFDVLINHSGPGTKSAFIKGLDVQVADGLRICLGVPEAWLTESRQQVAEAVYSYVFDKPFSFDKSIWTDAPSFTLKNPNRSDDPLLTNSVIDREFMESTGFKLSVWEECILKTNLTSYFNRIANGDSVGDQNYRMLIALAVFGFSEPYEFFTEK